MPESACRNRTYFQKGEALPLEREYTDYKAEICKILSYYVPYNQPPFSDRYNCMLFIHSLNRKTAVAILLATKKCF